MPVLICLIVEYVYIYREREREGQWSSELSFVLLSFPRLSGRLKTYICEELNVKDIETSDQPLQYASLKAEPEFSVLGKKVGKAMGAVSKAVKALSQQEILDFQSSGQLTVEGHTLVEGDIKVSEL